MAKGLDDMKARNLFRNRMSCIEKEVESMWDEVDKILLGDDEQKYEISKEKVLDTGADIMAYFGEIAQEFDKFADKNADN